MGKVKMFLFLIYQLQVPFLLACILLNVCAKTGWCFDDAGYYDGFLINQMMVLKIREFRGESASPENFKSLFDEAQEKGVTLPAWVHEDFRKKIFNIDKQGFYDEQRTVEFESIIFDASKKYRLPPALIKAIIKVESNFDSDAVSPKGAQGLMQLMPDTSDFIGVRDAFNARENIFAGSLLLKKYITKYGSLKKTLIAYNAGPGWVHKNRIPPETQSYIRNVVYYFKCYHDLN